MEDNHKFLVHDGHRYNRNRATNDKTYWRCAYYHKYKCLARATTIIVNGYEMAKINIKNHNHNARSWK